MESSSILNAPKQKFLIPKMAPPKLDLNSKEPNFPKDFFGATPQKNKELNHSFLSSMSTNSKDTYTEDEFESEEEVTYPSTTILSLISV